MTVHGLAPLETVLVIHVIIHLIILTSSLSLSAGSDHSAGALDATPPHTPGANEVRLLRDPARGLGITTAEKEGHIVIKDVIRDGPAYMDGNLRNGTVYMYMCTCVRLAT